MSLKTDLAARGVKLSDLARELEEAYGNLYTALQLEDQGKEVRHRAVAVRLDKVREWLAQDRAGEARTAASVEASTDRAAMRARWASAPVPEGWQVLLTARAGEREVACGDVLSVVEGETVCRYRFLRWVDAPSGTWVDVYGGPGLKEKAFPRTRSLRPERLGLERAS